MKDVILFWGTGPKTKVQKGIFSNWYPCRFSVDGQEYSSAEQYMMAGKAKLFGDTETLDKILATDKPAEIKRLGRLVKGFDKSEWDKAKFQIVVDGNYAKFSQNKAFKDFLLATGDAVLAEASPKDKIWGIGLREEDEDASDPSKWKGKNLLGKALMEVRKMLRSGKTMKLDEEYTISDNFGNTIWIRAGDEYLKSIADIEKKLTAGGREKVGNPLFLTRDLGWAMYYAKSKHSPWITFVSLHPDTKFVDLTKEKDLGSIGIDPVFAKEFKRYEPYFSYTSEVFNDGVQVEEIQGKYSPWMAMAWLTLWSLIQKSGRQPGSIIRTVSKMAPKLEKQFEKELASNNGDVIRTVQHLTQAAVISGAKENYGARIVADFITGAQKEDYDVVVAYLHSIADIAQNDDYDSKKCNSHVSWLLYMLHKRIRESGYNGYYAPEHDRPLDNGMGPKKMHDTVALMDITPADDQSGRYSAAMINQVESFPVSMVNYAMEKAPKNLDGEKLYEWILDKCRPEEIERQKQIIRNHYKAPLNIQFDVEYKKDGELRSFCSRARSSLRYLERRGQYFDRTSLKLDGNDFHVPGKIDKTYGTVNFDNLYAAITKAVRNDQNILKIIEDCKANGGHPVAIKCKIITLPRENNKNSWMTAQTMDAINKKFRVLLNVKR